MDQESKGIYLENPISLHDQGSWCLIRLRNLICPKDLPFVATLYHADSQKWEEEQYLLRPKGMSASYRQTILYIPPKTEYIRIVPIYAEIESSTWLQGRIYITSLPRFTAALFLAAQSPGKIAKALFSSPLGIKRRLQSLLSRSITVQNKILDYKHWKYFYDRWTEKEHHALEKSSYRDTWPSIRTILYRAPDYSDSVTQISLKNQWYSQIEHKDKTKQYCAILQNGEILPPHALTLFADQAARHNYPAALYADSDLLNALEFPSNPLFKPQIGLPLLASGVLTQDVWLFRQDIFENYDQRFGKTFQSAYAHRLALALFIWEQHLPSLHIPFILTHCKIQPNQQACAEMMLVMKSYLQHHSWNTKIDNQQFPFHIQFQSDHHPISLVIPTAANSPEVSKCLNNLLKKTHYPNLELILVLSQDHAPSTKQKAFLKPLLTDSRVKIVRLQTNQFNFSKACNFGVKHAQHTVIGLVNDDIVPIDQHWLSNMAGHLEDDSVGAVGAQLFYPNGQIQHAGIIMGTASLCDHASRFSKAIDNPTLKLDHDVSAVTGACMLIRHSAFLQINGLNEHYEIAYNDVDFCLRLREAGWRIIQCQNARLIHYESLSLKHHYTGTRAGKERQEILSMRQKWETICQNDPFYNPNLSLQRGLDYQLAFPPRVFKPFTNNIS